MSDVATFVRIFEPSPSDDFVAKRIKAAQEISGRYLKKGATIETLISTADNIAAAADDVAGVDSAFADDVAKLINAQSTSFVREGHEQELAAMMLIGAHQAFATARGASRGLLTVDVLAGALWSALSYQAPNENPKFEALRAGVLEKARRRAADAAEVSRRRAVVPEVTFKLPENPDHAAVAELIKTATHGAFLALRDNAALDREEINMLWWAMSDFSPSLNATLSKSPEHTGAVVAGVELAALLKRLPADAHRHLVVRHTKGTKRYALSDVVEALGENREAVMAPYTTKPALQDSPYVFPLFTGLINGAGDDDVKLTAADWGARALLEAALLNAHNMSAG
ncbi:MAG: hypothetical protein DCF16_09455 [Alphaproteobacteria bacterium]|nr:MAG: hypothetical protein DCF16_09455 [Alphaproteobacteria bacterium]